MKKFFKIFKQWREPAEQEGSTDSSRRMEIDRSSPPVFDAMDPDYVMDPYAFFTWWREEHPVFRSAQGSWIVSRFEDVSRCLTDSRVGNAPSPFAVVHERNRGKYVCADVANNIIPFLDSPLHERPRRLIARSFHSHVTRNPLPLEEMVRSRIKSVKGNDKIDLVGDIGTPFSIEVLCRLLGLPEDQQDLLKKWTEAFFYLFASMPSEEVRDMVDLALAEFRDFLKTVISMKRSRPGEDLISVLLGAEDGGEKLSEAELVDHCMLLFADGVENVDRAIGNSVVSLLQGNGQWELLKKDGEMVPAAVEECLRFEAPAQFVGKVAKEDIELHGSTIKKHSGILLLLGSANRDPQRFTRADEFLMEREDQGHLAFGKGRHSCVGAYLVKEELAAVLRVLVEEMPEMKLAGEKIEWVPRLAHRWIKEAWVRR